MPAPLNMRSSVMCPRSRNWSFKKSRKSSLMAIHRSKPASFTFDRMGEVQSLHDRLDHAARRKGDGHAQCAFVALGLLQGIELAPEQRWRHEMIAAAAQAV